MFAFQMIAPVEAFTATSRWADLPPTVVNVPPMKTVLPLTAIVWTVPLTLGFQGVTSPVARSMAAARFRATPVPAAAPAPRTAVNMPPM